MGLSTGHNTIWLPLKYIFQRIHFFHDISKPVNDTSPFVGDEELMKKKYIKIGRTSRRKMPLIKVILRSDIDVLSGVTYTVSSQFILTLGKCI